MPSASAIFCASVLAAKQQPPRRGRGAEAVAGAGALEAALEVAGLHRQPDADDGLVGRDHRGQHVAPRRAGVLADRQRRRPCRNAGMQHGADMGVVAVEARAEGDVEECRVLRIDRLGLEQHMRIAGTADQPDIAPRPVAPRQPRADRAERADDRGTASRASAAPRRAAS